MYVSNAKREAASKYLALHHTKKDRKFISRMFNEGRYVPVPSMMAADHCVTGEDGAVTYFGFYYFGSELTVEDIDEYFNDMRVDLPYYDYDCSGRQFTSYLHWHINPCGLVSMVHHLCLDI